MKKKKVTKKVIKNNTHKSLKEALSGAIIMKHKKAEKIYKRSSLASYIAKKEGKKHQASIGDIREILKILEDLFRSEADLYIGSFDLKAREGFAESNICTFIHNIFDGAFKTKTTDLSDKINNK